MPKLSQWSPSQKRLINVLLPTLYIHFLEHQQNRNGPDGLVYNAFVDWSNVKIKILEESPEEAEIGAKDTLSYLKNKYSNLSGSK
mgnify:CR=1 FL=1